MTAEIEQHQVKLFGKWSYEGVECKDVSLVVSRVAPPSDVFSNPPSIRPL